MVLKAHASVIPGNGAHREFAEKTVKQKEESFSYASSCVQHEVCCSVFTELLEVEVTKVYRRYTGAKTDYKRKQDFCL